MRGGFGSLLLSSRSVRFPPATSADSEGLVAVGGDLKPGRLLEAYRCGIFPWYNGGVPPLWWSPDPRAVFESVHVSRSLRRRLRKGGFEIGFDRDFRRVMELCADRDETGTWILPEMVDAYAELHALGHAHSVEVMSEGELIGGLYGVQVGGLFAAESMFHRRTDASKIALACCVEGFRASGIGLFDVQFLTDHLATLGAVEISRDEYLARLKACVEREVSLDEHDLQRGLELACAG